MPPLTPEQNLLDEIQTAIQRIAGDNPQTFSLQTITHAVNVRMHLERAITQLNGDENPAVIAALSKAHERMADLDEYIGKLGMLADIQAGAIDAATEVIALDQRDEALDQRDGAFAEAEEQFRKGYAAGYSERDAQIENAIDGADPDPDYDLVAEVPEAIETDEDFAAWVAWHNKLDETSRQFYRFAYLSDESRADYDRWYQSSRGDAAAD